MLKGFKMKLYPGMEAEYERRHKLLWPEMKDMIHEHGGKNYSIFLDRDTLTLFGYIEIEDEVRWAASADTAINRKWWRPIRTTARSASTCTRFSIWIDKRDGRCQRAARLVCI